MLTVKNIAKKFGNKTVFENISFQVNKGDHIAIFAPSGGGKTTLANIIAGVISTDSGEVLLNTDTTVSYLFQEDRLLPWSTAYKNVNLVNRSCKPTEFFFEALLLQKEMHQYPAQFSGGMRRRIALARALAFDGDLLLLDEPLKGLDEALKNKIIAFLKEYLQDKTYLLITHDPEEALALCDKQLNFHVGLTDLSIKK